MPIKTLENLFSLAGREKANRLTISGDENDFGCQIELPLKEEAYFKIPKKLEADLIESLRRLLKIAPDELVRGRYCKLRSPKYRLNFMLSIFPDKYGEKIVISPVKDSSSLFRLSKLGLQKKEKQILERNKNKKTGLILISSKERQGRTSTLFSILESLNRDEKSVYFMGSYPEFNLNGVISLKDSRDNWERVMRHDSDVLALDDDNPENIKQAIKAASTGRLVIATIEAVNSFEALYKVLSLGLPFNLVLDNLNIITSQSLHDLKRAASKNFRPNRTKIAAFEVLGFDKNLKEYIKEHQAQVKTKVFWQKVLQIAKKNGYQAKAIDALQKERDGII